MEKEREMLAVEKEAHRLIEKSFRREVSGSSAIHVYNLCTHCMIQITKTFLPPIFPQSSGKLRSTKRGSKQRRTYNCCCVIVVECSWKHVQRKGMHGLQQSQPQQTDCPRPP